MNEEMAKKLRFLLQTQGVSYRAAAEHLGVPNDHFQSILDGIITPTPRQIYKLAGLCKVSPEFLQPGVFQDMDEDEEKSGGPRKPLTLELLAVRFQALCECLVNTGVISAGDLRKYTEDVEMRAAARLREKSLADAKAKKQGGRARMKA